MSQPFIGPLPYPDLPLQPTFDTWCTTWTSYDVPRIWDIVRLENDSLGWAQVLGFRQLSDLLVDQYRRLRTQRNNLADAWRAPAADVFLSRLDSFSLGLLSDANCAATTASALNGIMTTYADARKQISALSERWDRVTTDLVPEWWDQAAADLNTQAAQIMYKTDEAVRDHRTRIIIPAQAWSSQDSPASTNAAQIHQQPNRSTIPPIPGRFSTSTTYRPATQPHEELGPALAGTPTAVQAVPSEPVSMLPIPPGSPYAPGGGAYILPGRGVGTGGYIVPMVPRTTTRSPTSTWAGSSNGGAPGPGAVGMMPPARRKEGSSSAYRRRSNYVWQVAQGVPPVIEPAEADLVIPRRSTVEQEDAFQHWFAELAHPWRTQANSSEPEIVIRRVAT